VLARRAVRLEGRGAPADRRRRLTINGERSRTRRAVPRRSPGSGSTSRSASGGARSGAAPADVSRRGGRAGRR
jgi:hypothetical protein